MFIHPFSGHEGNKYTCGGDRADGGATRVGVQCVRGE